MNKYLNILLLSFLLISAGCQAGFNRHEEKPAYEDAVEYAQSHIIVDGHVDMPYSVYNTDINIAEETDNDFDYVKAKAGGLNAPFMSIYTPSRYQITGGAKAHADSLIALVKSIATEYPEKFAIATSPEEIKRQFEKGLISMALGMENGAPIGHDLSRIEYYYDKGIRYITLTHGTDNLISDSSYDTSSTHNGLSDFGYKVVEKMNKVGIMVDVSHLSDEAFYDVMEATKAPVIASHSSCRFFTPGWERNMSDAMLKRLAENGGVIMINFGSAFISDAARASDDSIDAYLATYFDQHPQLHTNAEEYAEEYFEKHYAYATVEQVADHFDHVVNLIGIEHVGIGSDFDGVGNTLPRNLSSAAELPNLILELMERGYTEAELNKITHGNVFRVWNKVAEVAQTLNDRTITEVTN